MFVIDSYIELLKKVRLTETNSEENSRTKISFTAKIKVTIAVADTRAVVQLKGVNECLGLKGSNRTKV